MQSNLFKLIYSGELMAGVDVDETVEAFAAMFKLPDAKARAIITAGRDVILKPKAEHVAAYRLKRAVEELGLVVRLERITLNTPVPSTPPKKPEAQPAVSTAAEAPTDASDSGWSLVPMETPPADESEVSNADHPGQSDGPGNTPSPVTSQLASRASTADDEDEAKGFDWRRLKGIGGIVGGLAALLFVLIKKAGLFKVLKIGGVLAASSMIDFGYDPVAMCMNNADCQALVEDRDEDCWEASGLDDVDWEAISDDEVVALISRIDQEYFGCLRYDTGQRAFLSPFTLQLDLIDNCFYTDDEHCLTRAGEQMNACYDNLNMSSYVGSETTDLYLEIRDNSLKFKQFYQCFEAADGQPLFQNVLGQWELLYDPENWQ